MPTGKKSPKAAPPAKAAAKPAAKKAPVKTAAQPAPKAKVKAAAKAPIVEAPAKAAAAAKAVKVSKPAKISKPAAAKPAAKKVAAPKIAEPKVAAKPATPAAAAREKKYTEFFGPSQPKGKGLNAQGEVQSAAQAEEQGWSLMQFPPPAGRMSWVYATHGLSALKQKDSDKPVRVELVMHWREKHTLPLQMLSDVAAFILASGTVPAAAQIITAEEGINSPADLAKHVMLLEAAPHMPSRVETPGGGFVPLVVLGISDAELEYAMKVPAELADGKQVLMEALRMGGVFPVTDPKRLCLTRRRDFNKIWETAFRTIRERKRV